jgi:hypothetical protein
VTGAHFSRCGNRFYRPAADDRAAGVATGIVD